jgi:single-stranded DNA-binding protein
MNSFTFIGIGNLARNPEVTAKGDVAYVRFCLIGEDHAELDEEVRHAREVVNSVWFLAFDEIGDRIATHARKGDQLIVRARIRSRAWIDREGERRWGNVFIVTGLRFGAKGGPGSAASSLCGPRPQNPVKPAVAVAMGMGAQRDRQFGERPASGSVG